VRSNPAWQGSQGQAKKSPGSCEPGWEAFLLSHIKAPAQGGKAGSGKPPETEFNRPRMGFQA
jgi:hypothetical protein